MQLTINTHKKVRMTNRVLICILWQMSTEVTLGRGMLPENRAIKVGINLEVNKRPSNPSLHYGLIDSKSPKFACLIASKI